MTSIGCPRFTKDAPITFPKADRQPFRLVVSQAEACELLRWSAQGYERETCDRDECPACNAFRACWWDVYNALPRQLKLDLARGIMRDGNELPEAPWELEN